MAQLYLRPTGLVPNPQSVDGDAIRLAGGLVYAHAFALIVREGGGKVV
jgi:dihydropteroate synthase